MEFDSYEEAYAVAILRANSTKQAHGIQKPNPPLQRRYTVQMIPNQRNHRFGWEQRCQSVEVGDLLSQTQKELIARLITSGRIDERGLELYGSPAARK